VSIPFSPRNDALFGARRVWEHGDVLQQVTVWIVKEDGRGRHPGEHHGLVGRLPVKVERRDACRSQSTRCCDNICQARAKRRVQRHPLWARAGPPQSQHRVYSRDAPGYASERCRPQRSFNAAEPVRNQPRRFCVPIPALCRSLQLSEVRQQRRFLFRLEWTIAVDPVGAEDTETDGLRIRLNPILEYNQDPTHLRDQLLYRLTLEAQKRIAESPLAKREIVRRLGTSTAQLYRLLDQTNYRKSVDQLLSLLQVLKCDVKLVVRQRDCLSGSVEVKSGCCVRIRGPLTIRSGFWGGSMPIQRNMFVVDIAPARSAFHSSRNFPTGTSAVRYPVGLFNAVNAPLTLTDSGLRFKASAGANNDLQPPGRCTRTAARVCVRRKRVIMTRHR
jgi:hypothetical protein